MNRRGFLGMLGALAVWRVGEPETQKQATVWVDDGSEVGARPRVACVMHGLNREECLAAGPHFIAWENVEFRENGAVVMGAGGSSFTHGPHYFHRDTR